MVYSKVRVELNDRFTVVLTIAVGCVHLYLHYSVPGGPIAVPLDPGRGEDLVLAEGFRSDMLVWLRLEGLRVASRCSPARSVVVQRPLLEAAIEGNIVADFPLCNKSFNCSYSGHDL
jgi:Ni,Fe-hydrogenase III large subunit